MPKGQVYTQATTTGGTNDPTAVPARTGPGEEGWYRSEFGCVAWSSFESMTAQMPEEQWSMASRGAWVVRNTRRARDVCLVAAKGLGRSCRSAPSNQTPRPSPRHRALHHPRPLPPHAETK